MSFNITELAKQAITPELISKFSSEHQENESSIKKGVEAFIPTILLGLINQPSGSSEGLWSVAKGFLGDATTSGTSITDKITGFIKQLFGDKLSGIISTVSSYAGLKPSSAQGLLETITPTTLGALTQQATSSDSNGIFSFLKNNASSILSALPAGLSLSSLGFSGLNIPSLSGTTPKATTNITTPEVEKPKGGSFGKIIIALIILGALIYFFRKGCNKTEETVTVTDTTTIVEPKDSTPATAVDAIHESIKVILPSGKELDAYKGGIEDKLVAFLKTDYKKLGDDSLKKVWFDFDNLNFETASAKITAESKKQIDNIVAILKEFPNAKIKIGGYTDKTGDEKANLKLSSERATSVQTELKNAGVGTQVTGAEGYGSQYAKYPASASENERVTDRHVSVSVR